ncbi:MAG TPA: beta-propeller domain-containing protein [Usitatibacter sp.]|nr:beta-propeller domain-containing protein [Usitatibacter sp.]
MKLKSALLGLAALFACSGAWAASVADRSPFAQGLWWDPSRSGSGFEMFNAAGQVMVIWYTFDEAGRPTWYTAQGTQDSLGQQSWPLMKHRWLNGRKVQPVVAGSLKLTPANSESAEVAWEIGSQRGTAKVEPFIQSGVVNEIDRSGTWFDAANSGWGLTLLEQGDVTGAALFTYDAAGEPTWAAGFERGSGSVALSVSSGACPWCAYRQPNTVPAGRVSFDFRGEASLTLRDRTTLAMASGLGIDGANLSQLSRPASMRAADRQLASFDAAALRSYLAAGLLSTPVYQGVDFSPPPAPTVASVPPVSSTNLQEAGVDEAALVQSTSTHIYTYGYSNGTRRNPTVRVARVEGGGASAKAVGLVDIGTGSQTPMGIAGLYLYGSNLISVHGSQSFSYAYAWWTSGAQWTNGLTQVEILDISSPEQPVSRWRADIDGYIVSSRRVGSKLYLVSRFTPYLPGFTFNAYTPAQRAANDEILATVALDTMLPKARVTDGSLAAIVQAPQVYAPPLGSRKPTADLILITAIDLDQRRIVQSMAIAGPVETVYVSTDNLFVASSRTELRNTFGTLLPEPPMSRTDMHQVRLGRESMSIVGSSTVEGYLAGNPDQAPFRLSEHQGKLRVVTTSSNGIWGGEQRNRLTILEPSTVAPGLLKTLSWLPNANRPQSLGKPGEQLHGTRFVGDRLYAVTFKKVDPLYVVDLSNSSDPRIAGALEIPGFSEYLHPLPNGLLLGFGKDTVPALDFGDGGQFAWYQGLQMALYDVSDAGKPVEKQRLVIGKRGSQSALLQHHHAFSSLAMGPDLTRIAIPASVSDGYAPMYGSGPSAPFPWAYSGLLRFELRGSTPADARLTAMEPLVSNRAIFGYPYPSYPAYPDPGATDGRSVLFPNGTVFVGNGQFWHQGESGGVTGPF